MVGEGRAGQSWFRAFAIGHGMALALAGDWTTRRRFSQLEPTFRIRMTRALGYAPALEEKCIRGARLLGARERVAQLWLERH